MTPATLDKFGGSFLPIIRYQTIKTSSGNLAVIPEKELEKMIAVLEDVEDCRSIVDFKALLKAGVAETVPAEVVHRILAGDKPIRVWRNHFGLSQDELAEKSGVSQPTISKMEKGGDGNVATFKSLASALGVSVDDILPD
ncbi:MAG: helix-turn-helix domain-containing protein [Proteobacteria bacterium]|nr:helix-turn-helix domain-containing protein [Pseudomonadota bacterium]